jgi:uncharacterized membrane protein
VKEATSERTLGPKWVITALLAGLVAAVTLFLRIPIPKSGGYLNLGDIIVIFAGLYLGPLAGLLVGGVGSAVADSIGYPIFIVPTLVIKGLEGMLAGIVPLRLRALRVLGAIAGGIAMVAGYYFVEAFIFGSIGPAAAKAEFPFNVVQGVVGIIGGYTMYLLISRWSREEDDE